MNSRDKSYNSSSGWKRKKDGKRGRLYSGCGHISRSPRATQCRTYVWAYLGFTTFSSNTSLVLIYSYSKGKRDILSNKTTQTHFPIYAFIWLVEREVFRQGKLRRRICHFDTNRASKINNIIIDYEDKWWQNI